jgi:hypothetical protein
MTAYEKGTLYNLDLNLIQADLNQPRKVMEASLSMTGRDHPESRCFGAHTLPGGPVRW